MHKTPAVQESREGQMNIVFPYLQRDCFLLQTWALQVAMEKPYHCTKTYPQQRQASVQGAWHSVVWVGLGVHSLTPTYKDIVSINQHSTDHI